LRLLSGMLGLGDNIYQRAVVRELGAVHLVTSWPQLYADLPGVRCVRPTTRLRTQSKNAARDDLTWSTVSRGTAPRRIGYDGRDTILASLMRSAGIAPARVTFDGPPVEAREGRYILVRPATVRTEWPAASRNPARGSSRRVTSEDSACANAFQSAWRSVRCLASAWRTMTSSASGTPARRPASAAGSAWQI